MNKFIALLTAFLPLLLSAQINGPMIGYVDHMEAHIWVQVPKGQEITLSYGIAGHDTLITIPSFRPKAEDGFTHTFVLSGLIPGQRYDYDISLNNKRLDLGNLHFNTEPLVLFSSSLPNMRIALGSCAYFNDAPYDRPGKPYGVENNIFNTIADQNPDITLWLGDNIYLREPDWGSRSGYIYRYTHMRGQDSLQRLLRTGAHYAIWDDHDFGPNNSNGSWYNAAVAKETFKDFWANPSYGLPGVSRGIATQFDHADIGFFLVDNRTYREPPSDKAQLLGKKQLEQLLDALESSKHSFKLVAVGGQMLSSAQVFENYANYVEEREYLLKEIEKRNIKNVVFLTGDRHSTTLSSITNDKGNLLYDLTVSPLSSTAYIPEELNKNLMKGTVVGTQNFGLLDISGEKDKRVLKITILSPEGELFWEKTIVQQN